MAIKELLLATNNPGKVVEMRDLLAGISIDVIGLRDLANFTEVPETGDTFRENASLKAIGYAQQAGMIAIADDSGLEVNALGGRPGVYSARYGGDDLGFDAKMRLLLDEIAKTGDPDRSARFVSAVSIAEPDGTLIFETEGYCTGRIDFEPRGTGGFGYDPLFVPDGFEMTFGQLDSSIKREISHRAAAFREIIPFLRHFNGVST
jgi:XTP/dITP diphosphohydrolase